MEKRSVKVKATVKKKKDESIKNLKSLQDMIDLASKAADNADNKQLVQFMCRFIYDHQVKAEFIGNDVVVFTDDGKVFIISAMVPKTEDKSDETKEVKPKEDK